MKRRLKNKKGFSVIELVIALGIGALIIGAVTVGTKSAQKNARLKSTVDSVNSLRTAGELHIADGNTTFASQTVATLKTAGHLPANFNPTGSNSYGGNFSFAPDGTDATIMVISLTAITASTRTDLDKKFANSATALTYDAGTSTWSISF